MKRLTEAAREDRAVPTVPPVPRRSWVEQIMGMPISVLARGAASSSARAATAVQAVFEELVEVDRTFSTYRPDSEVSRINRGELELADCSAGVRAVAQACERAYETTGGLFQARRPDGAWDPSGYVKGWAAERVFVRLSAVEDLDWCLNAGGDVIVRCRGPEPFRIGVADPADPARVATVVSRRAGAVATSGSAARGNHLYDPRTGGPAAAVWASVTVVGSSLAMADVLATAAFVAGSAWREVVRAAPGYSGLAVAPDGALVQVGVLDD